MRKILHAIFGWQCSAVTDSALILIGWMLDEIAKGFMMGNGLLLAAWAWGLI